MKFLDCYNENEIILMEGAIGERLKREYSIYPDNEVALASHIYHMDSKQALREIFSQYIQIAEMYQYPIMVTTPTRRANKDVVARSEYTLNIIEDNVRFIKELSSSPSARIYIGGLMGCRGDAYKATEVLSVQEAFEFHSWQADLFRKQNVDYLYAGIMPAISEAIVMAKDMEATELPYL
ncbi:MAG: homocysteine S-methyltransferase family protein, partial [Mobilitalea sp.]